MPLDLKTHTTLHLEADKVDRHQREAFGPGVSDRKARDNGS